MTASDMPAPELPAPSAANGSVRTTSSGKRFTLLNVVVVFAAFVVFWPLGLFLLIWICLGRTLGELCDLIADLGRKVQEWFSRQSTLRAGSSGNRVFDDYQQTQHDRIEEIRQEIRERDKAFREFKVQQDREMEQKQFDDFIQKTPAAVAAD